MSNILMVIAALATVVAVIACSASANGRPAALRDDRLSLVQLGRMAREYDQLSAEDGRTWPATAFVLAGVGIAGVVFNILGLAMLRDAALVLVFALWTAWWIWLLVLIRRGSMLTVA